MNEGEDPFICLQPLAKKNILYNNVWLGKFKNNTLPSKWHGRWQYKGSWANGGEANYVNIFQIWVQHAKWRRKGATRLRRSRGNDLL